MQYRMYAPILTKQLKVSETIEVGISESGGGIMSVNMGSGSKKGF